MDSSPFAKPNKAFRIIDLIKEVNASGSVKAFAFRNVFNIAVWKESGM